VSLHPQYKSLCVPSQLPSFDFILSLLLDYILLNSPKMTTPSFNIPKECKAGVVVDEGPNFRVEVKMVPVPEIGIAPLALPFH
jgi:hypothetical protein